MSSGSGQGLHCYATLFLLGPKPVITCDDLNVFGRNC